MKVAVITVSDRAYTGTYEDKSGPELEAIFCEQFDDIEIKKIIVPDDEEKILQALIDFSYCNYIITTGGTGISERDITPDVCAKYCDKALPGISETLRAESYKETAYAMLSRGFAGIKNKTIIVNFPGSIKAVRTCSNVLIPVMKHSLDMLEGKGH